MNGTYWAGAIIGTLGTFVLLNQISLNIGWRLGFLIGPILGLMIWNLRRHLPESPRWLIMHGRETEAEANLSFIEREVEQSGQKLAPVDESRAIDIKPSRPHGYVSLIKVYNAIFFTYTLVLKFCSTPGR